MKKFRIILILLVLPLLLTGCVKKDAEEKSGGLFGNKNEEKVVSDSVFDLMKSGKPSKCTASVTEEGNTMEMTTYISGDKMYSETSFVIPDQPEESTTMYTIVDKDYMYTWGDLQMPTKISIKDMEDMEVDMEDSNEPAYESSVAQSQALNEEIDYKCVPWIPNPDKFQPPSDLVFEDMTQTMKDMMDSFESGEFDDIMNMACQMCENMPTAQEVADCKVEAGCE